MPTDEQRSAFRRRLASTSDKKIRAKLHVWKPWKRELAEEELAQRERGRDEEQQAGMGRGAPLDSKHRRRRSWRRELFEQVQLVPKKRAEVNRPAVAATVLVAAAAIAALTLLLRYVGVI